MSQHLACLFTFVLSGSTLFGCAGKPIEFKSTSGGTGGIGIQNSGNGGTTTTGGATSSTNAGAAGCVTRNEKYDITTKFPQAPVADLTVYPECIPTCGVSQVGGQLSALALPAGACTAEPACQAPAYPASCPPCSQAPGPYDGYLCACTNGRWSCSVAQPGAGVCDTTGCPSDPLSGSGGASGSGGSQATGGASGGQGGTSGASGVDCSLRAPNDCTGTCTPISGSPVSDMAKRGYEGCMASAMGCTAAFTCAYPPGHPESCLLFSSGCIPPGWTGDMSCTSTLCPRFTANTPSSCQPGVTLSGSLYDIAKSRFAFGSTPTRENSSTMTRWLGADGVVAISMNGSEMGIMNAGAPEVTLPDWSPDSNVLAQHVLEYFESMGVSACQVSSTSALGGSLGLTIGLNRAVDGIRIVESYAYAKINSADQSTSEDFYWPPIPADTVSAAQNLRSLLTDPQSLANYKARLPATAQGEGRIVIHHSGATSTSSYQTAATYDVDYSSPLGMGTTLSFDTNANPVTTTW